MQPLNAPNAQAAKRATIVLDPDDNVGHVDWPGDGTVTELPLNYRLASEVKKRLEEGCKSNVVLTRDDKTDFVPQASRKATALAANPDVMVTLAFNALTSGPWGIEADGGPRAFARPQDTAFAQYFLNQIPTYTGRHATAGVGPLLYDAYADLPFPYAHVEALFMDHNYDYPVIKTGFDHIADAVTAAISDELKAKGFGCVVYPERPSAAELQRLRNLGYQNFQRYGADPVSMSTGNFVTSEELLTLSGVGSQTIDTSITYNSQSGQDSSVGYGWMFGYGATSQEYDDGSVSVALGDGRTFVFDADGDNFKTPAGSFASLTRIEGGVRFATTTGEASTFAVDEASGRGVLASATDRQGNKLTFTHDGRGSGFPKLTKITDEAGQEILATTDEVGRVTSWKRPDGALWQLAYSAAGDLISITSPGGRVRKFEYDDKHRMTAEIGADNVTYLTNAYDANSRVVAQANSTGKKRKLVYDDDKRTTTYTDLTGAVTVYHWNAAGQVVKVEDALGHDVTSAYDDEGQPAKETNALGDATTTSYDKSGRVSKTVDQEGRTSSAKYNNSGDLTSSTDRGTDGDADRTTAYDLNDDGLPAVVTNPDGSKVRNEYDAHGDLTRETDELGRVKTFAYDDRGNVVRITDPNEHVTTQTFDLANRLTSATDALGNTTEYSYDADDNLVKTAYPDGSTETLEYDANGQVTKSTDRRGSLTTYKYNSELDLIETTPPSGAVLRNTYDAERRLTSSTDARGGTTKYTLDALGRVIKTKNPRGHTTTITYDAAGQVVAETDATGAKTTYRRDATGLVTTKTAPNRGKTSQSYDSFGRLVKATNPNGRTTRYSYNWRDAQTKETDASGYSVKQAYDAAGQLVSRTDQSGAVTKYSYDGAGNLLTVTDANGGVTRNSYDDANRLVQVVDANGHVDKKLAYDKVGNLISQVDGTGRTTTMTYDKAGTKLSQTDALGKKTAYTYDSSGRLISTTDPLGRVTRQAYSKAGDRTRLTKPSGVDTTYEYDQVGNLTKVVENYQKGVKASATTNVTTRYTYNERNQLATITDGIKAVTKFSYDNMGQLTTETNPLGKKTRYSYDLAGNQTQRTAGNGTVTAYTYNARNELIRRTYNKSTKEYLEYTPTGLLKSAKNSVGIVKNTYDKLGRMTRETDAGGKQTILEYDKVGNRTRQTLPGSRVTDYTYDDADQLVSQDSPLGQIDYTYDDAGRPLTTKRPNGTTTTQVYDAAGQLLQKRTTKGAQVVASFDYTYTADSYVASRSQKIGSQVDERKYSYDALGRLTKSSGGPVPSSYSYDAVGNRVKYSTTDDPSTKLSKDKISQTNKYNKAGQLTTSTTKRTVGKKKYTDVTTNSYDGSGNLTLSKMKAKTPGLSLTRAYKYTAENLLSAAGPATKYKNVCGLPYVNNKGCPSWLNKNSNPGNSGRSGRPNTLRRTYDALGRLVYEYNHKDITSWTHDGLDPVLSTNAKSVTQYVRDGQNALVAEQVDSSSARWYISDFLGSIGGHLDADGSVASTIVNYSDFGSQLTDSGYVFGFTGERTEWTSNRLVNFFARSADATQASWLQMDPNPGYLQLPATLAGHRYAAGNPVSYFDSRGQLIPFLIGAAALAILGSLAAPATAYAPSNRPDSNLEALREKEAQKRPQNLSDYATDLAPGVYAFKCAAGVYANCSSVDVGLSLAGAAPTLYGATRLFQRAREGYQRVQAMQNVTKLGREGEAAAGIIKNTKRIPSKSGSAEYRIPDELGNGIIGEVKNVKYQELSSQLLDDLAYAESQQPPLLFKLYVRRETELSKPLQELERQGRIKIERSL